MAAAKSWTGIPQAGDDTIITGGTIPVFYGAIPAGTLALIRGGAPLELDMYGGSFGPGLTVTSTGEGGPVALNIIGTALDFPTFVNGGMISDSFGVLNMGVTGLTAVTNNGGIMAQGRMGNSTLNINLTSDASNTNPVTPGPTSFSNNGDIAALAGILDSAVNINLNSTTATFDNKGTIEADATAQHTLIQIAGPGHFDNDGLILIQHNGTLSLSQTPAFANRGIIDATDMAQGGTTSAIITLGTVGSQTIFTNSGTILAEGQAGISISAARAFETLYGTLVNSNEIEAKGGDVTINAQLVQSAGGRIDIENGGSVWLGGAAQGGLIRIDNGTLAFGGSSRVAYGPTAARSFASTLSFTGTSGSLDFTFAAPGVSETYSQTAPGSGELVVSDGLNRLLADFHLVGNYKASDFSASGSLVNFAASAALPGPTPSPTPTPIPASDDLFSIVDTSQNLRISGKGEDYHGPVAGIQHQYISTTPNNLNITASVPNSFIHTGAGTDAIDVSKAGGNNVLDGSTGSNFLVGGSGNDTFFVDDRIATADIWSTIVNFHADDAATIFGVTQSGFSLDWQNDQGAAGFTGLTLHVTAAGKPAAAMTLAGFTKADLTNGRLAVSFGNDAASGSNFMYVHGN